MTSLNKENKLNLQIGAQEKDYNQFLETVTTQFEYKTKLVKTLFITNVSGLYETYLNAIPEEFRQTYVCRTCKHFIERYGSLATLDDQGNMESVLWNIKVPEFFQPVVDAMNKAVLKSTVKAILVTKLSTLGKESTLEESTGIKWRHLFVNLPARLVTPSWVNTNEIVGQYVEEFNMVQRAVVQYDLDVVTEANRLLSQGNLYRADHVKNNGWFKDLVERCTKAENERVRRNIIWHAIATVPTRSFCHINSSVYGTLLSDVKEGYSYAVIKARFEEKMDPDNFMRSKSAPSSTQIQEGEKLIAELGMENSLARRYAKLEDIPQDKFIWVAPEIKEAVTEAVAEPEVKTGVFGNVVPKQPKVTNAPQRNPIVQSEIPPVVMTWEKFKRTVLSQGIDKLEAKLDNTSRLMAMVTAEHEDAPILLNHGNHFSWYYEAGADGAIKERVKNAGGKYEDNEIRCSLMWDGYTDLDLHIHTQQGHIYYNPNNRKIGTGYLDIDMNGGYHRESNPVENIRWASDAPHGEYVIIVHNYEHRTYSPVPFTVELEIKGQIFTFKGEASCTNDKFTIAAFDYYGATPVFTINNGMTTTPSNGVYQWNVEPNDFVPVKNIILSPNTWDNKPTDDSQTHMFFLLEGCKDTTDSIGRGFFSEMIIPELRPIRKVLESFTAVTPISGQEEASACGLGYSLSSDWNLTLRVTANGTEALYKIDRLD